MRISCYQDKKSLKIFLFPNCDGSKPFATVGNLLDELEGAKTVDSAASRSNLGGINEEVE